MKKSYKLKAGSLGLVIICSFILSIFFTSVTEAQVKASDTTKVTIANTSRTKTKKIKKRRAVYKLEAISVAEALGLNKLQSDSLAEAYRETRKNRKMELSKYPNKGDKSKYKLIAQEVNSKEREKLQNVLKGFLSEEQVDRALIPLCSFNPHWDSYVFMIREFKLEKEKMNSALNYIYAYIVLYEKSKAAYRRRGERTTLKNKLDLNLRQFLTEEQFSEWNAVTNNRKSGSSKNTGRK